MQKKNKVTKGFTSETVSGYHRSNFKKTTFWASDRPWALDRHFQMVPQGDRKMPAKVSGYGLEIETESQGIRGDESFANIFHGYLAAALPADLFRCEHDGSLGGGEIPGYERAS